MNLLCALLTSDRVGATSNCIHRFDEPSNSVLSTLIMTCMPRSMFVILEQSPVYILLMSSFVPHFFLKMTVTRRLSRKVSPAVDEHVHKTTSRLERHVRKVRARLFLGSTFGNQGLKSLAVASEFLRSLFQSSPVVKVPGHLVLLFGQIQHFSQVDWVSVCSWTETRSTLFCSE